MKPKHAAYFLIATVCCFVGVATSAFCQAAAPQQGDAASVGAKSAVGKPAGKPKKTTSQSSEPQKIKVTEYQPMFLQYVEDAQTHTPIVQTIRIEGTFDNPQSVKIVPGSGFLPDAQATITDTEILLDVTVAQNAPTNQPNLVITRDHDNNDHALLTFTLQEACKSHIQEPTTPPTPPVSWQGDSPKLCAVPTGLDCRRTLKQANQCTYGINALTHQRSTQLTDKFCDNSWSGFAHFDSSATYLTTRDSAVVLVCNQNPFRWTTMLSRNDTAIKNDDPSVFLGALNPAAGAANATNAIKTAASKPSPSTPPPGGISTNFAALIGPLSKILGEGGQPAQAPNTFNFNIHCDATDCTKQQLQELIRYNFYDPVQACVQGIANAVALDDDPTKPNTISSFINSYGQAKVVIEDDSSECKDRVVAARNLWIAAQSLPVSDLNQIQQEISSLRQEIDSRQQTLAPYSKQALAAAQTKVLQAQSDALDIQDCVVTNALKTATQDIVSKVVTPIQNILGTNGSFVYISTDVGKDHDPVERVWKLSSSLKPQSVLSDASNFGTNPYAGCAAKKDASQTNPKNPSQPGGAHPGQGSNPTPGDADGPGDNVSYRFSQGEWHLSDAVVRTAPGAPLSLRLSDVSQNGTSPTGTPTSPQNGTKGKANGSTSPAPSVDQTTDQNQAKPTQEDGPQIDATFGAPRFVVSSGAAGVVLRNRQYQKVQASGQTSGTTIEYSTNSLTRFNPLLMGHILLYQYPGRYDGLFATLGVTGSSNNQGASAEYLLGLTSSFAHDWVFVTPGLYIGQSQSLSGGYKVGQQLPSSFTGGVPTEQSYRPGFGLAISIRIPGTTSPKTKTPASNGNSKGNNSKQAGSTPAS